MRRIDHAFAIVARILLVCCLLFVFAAWLSYRERFQINEVRIEGTHAVDPAHIGSIVTTQLSRRLLWRIDRNNALLYPKQSIRSTIMTLDPRVKHIDLAVDGGKRLNVGVSEYTPAFLWCPPGSASATTTGAAGCSFADDTGHIFAPAPDYSGTPFVIFVTARRAEDGGAILAQEEFDKVNVFLRTLADLGLSPRRIEESGAHDFTIVTDQPWMIRWSATRDPQADARNLSLVLQNLNNDHVTLDTLKSIDLRFGNKVFYR